VTITQAADHLVVRPDPSADAPIRIDVPVSGPCVVVMRDDTAHFVTEFGRRLMRWNAAPPGGSVAALADGYREFQRDIRDAYRSVLRPQRRGGVRFHLVDAHRLESAVRRRAGSGPLISLDPLVERAVRPLHVSRGFPLGGRTPFGLVLRPGAAPIGRQLDSLRAYAGAKGCTLIEDDVCTGRTIASVISLLRAAGIPVRRVVPGIRLDGVEQARILGATIEPVLQYRTVGGTPGKSAVELTDPRNYLFGLSGLVVRLPDGSWGRAPYWLPFVETSARVGILTGADREFALRMLEANLRFFARAERLARRTVRVTDLHPSARQLVLSLGIAEPRKPVRSVLESIAAEMDRWIELIAGLEHSTRAPARSAA
jgi:hypothetical protein